jgi:cytidylate kinase
MKTPVDIHGIRNITVSGRIGAGATTVAQHLSKKINWELLEGGDLFEKIHKELGVSQVDVLARPDSFDLAYEAKIKEILATKTHSIIQSHLAGFDAQGIEGVFKILVICRDEAGDDKADIRIDRIMNRDGISLEQAKHEILEREKQNLEKFRRLYADNDQNWVYWNTKYYDLVVNTYSHNQEEALEYALEGIGYKK